MKRIADLAMWACFVVQAVALGMLAYDGALASLALFGAALVSWVYFYVRIYWLLPEDRDFQRSLPFEPLTEATHERLAEKLAPDWTFAFFAPLVTEGAAAVYMIVVDRGMRPLGIALAVSLAVEGALNCVGGADPDAKAAGDGAEDRGRKGGADEPPPAPFAPALVVGGE